VSAGLCYASGELVAVMDADLQDPPEELERFLDKCREGYDVVYAIRTKRKEGPLKRLSYWLYYRLIRVMSSIDIPVDAGDFCVMRRNVVDAINGLPERERFIRGLRTWVGSRQTGVAYERRARAFGEPKYTLRKLFALGLDGLIGFSMKPLRLLFFAGLAVALLAFFLGAFVLFQYLTNTTVLGYNPHQARGWTSLILAILFFAGTQLVAIGVLGEYLGRVFDELKRRPTYLVAEQHGFGHEQKLYPGLGPFAPGSGPPAAAR